MIRDVRSEDRFPADEDRLLGVDARDLGEVVSRRFDVPGEEVKKRGVCERLVSRRLRFLFVVEALFEGEAESRVERRGGFGVTTRVGESAGELDPGGTPRRRQRVSFTDTAQGCVRRFEGYLERGGERVFCGRLVGSQVDGTAFFGELEDQVEELVGRAAVPDAVARVDLDGRRADIVGLDTLEPLVSAGRATGPNHAALVFGVRLLLELLELPLEVSRTFGGLEEAAPAIVGRRRLGQNLIEEDEALGPLLALEVLVRPAHAGDRARFLLREGAALVLAVDPIVVVAAAFPWRRVRAICNSGQRDGDLLERLGTTSLKTP